MSELYGALEAGGTKFVCAVGTGPDDLRDVTRFPTTTPAETLGLTRDYFRRMAQKHGPIKSLGIGSFGPIDINLKSPTWGYITNTPKPHWPDTPLAPQLKQDLGVPVFFDTDVNGAVLAESLWGAGKGLKNLVYVTVGTGLGGGILCEGRLVHGIVHPELGHQLLPRRADDTFTGACPYHGFCLEGVASGAALRARWDQPGNELPPEHPAWDLEAHYLALGVQTWILAYSPERILLGGGVLGQDFLLPLIRAKVLKLLANYVRHPSLTPEGIEQYITAPGLGVQSGILGALALNGV